MQPKKSVQFFLATSIEGGQVELFEYCDPWIHRVRQGVIEVHGNFGVEHLLRKLQEKGVQFISHQTAKSELCLFNIVEPMR